MAGKLNIDLNVFKDLIGDATAFKNLVSEVDGAIQNLTKHMQDFGKQSADSLENARRSSQELNNIQQNTFFNNTSQFQDLNNSQNMALDLSSAFPKKQARVLAFPGTQLPEIEEQNNEFTRRQEELERRLKQKQSELHFVQMNPARMGEEPLRDIVEKKRKEMEDLQSQLGNVRSQAKYLDQQRSEGRADRIPDTEFEKARQSVRNITPPIEQQLPEQDTTPAQEMARNILPEPPEPVRPPVNRLKFMSSQEESEILRYKAMTGQSIASMQEAQQVQGFFGGGGATNLSAQLSESIKTLSETDAEGNALMIQELSRIRDTLDESKESFANSIRDYSAVVSDANATEEQKEQAFMELSRKIADGQRVMSEAEAARRASGGGGGEPPERPGFFERFGRGFQIAGAGLAGAAQVAQMGFDVYGQQERLGITAEQRRLGAVGGTQDIYARTLEEQYGTTNALDYIKQRGDILLGSQEENARYLGKTNQQEAFRKALEQSTRELSLEDQQSMMGLITGAMKAAGGAAATIGTGGVGTLAGAGIAASGVMDVARSGQGLLTNRADLMAGEEDQSQVREFFRSLSYESFGPEEFEKVRDEIRRAAQAEFGLDITQRQDQLRTQEARAVDYRERVGVQQYLDTRNVAARYATMLGGQTIGFGDVMSQTGIAGMRIPETQNLQRFNQLEADRDAAVEELRNLPSGTQRDARGRRLNEETPGVPPGLEQLRRIGDAARERSQIETVSEEERRAAEMYRDRARSVRTGLDNPFTAMGMSMSQEAELRNQFLLSQMAVIGDTPQERQRERYDRMNEQNRLMNLSMAGMGDPTEIMQNISTMNRIRGTGEDNLKELEEVFTRAVSAGFTNSRLAQQLVQTSTRMAENLDMTDVGEITRQLTASALGFATRTDERGMAVADERSLAISARGFQQMQQFTGQDEGYTGYMKMMTALSGGTGLFEGAGEMARMSAAELGEFESAVEEYQKTGNLRGVNQRFRGMIRIAQEEEGGVDRLRENIQQTREASFAEFGQLTELTGMDERAEEARRRLQEARTPQERQAAFAELTDVYGRVGAGVKGMDYAAGGAFAYEEARRLGIDVEGEGIDASADPRILEQRARETINNSLLKERERFSQTQRAFAQQFAQQGELSSVTDINRLMNAADIQETVQVGDRKIRLGEKDRLSQQDIQAIESDEDLMDRLKSRYTRQSIAQQMQMKDPSMETQKTFLDGISPQAMESFTTSMEKAFRSFVDNRQSNSMQDPLGDVMRRRR